MPRDYLRELDDLEKANVFIHNAGTTNMEETHRVHAASTIYLAYQTKAAGEKLSGSVAALTGALEQALAHHADALRAAASSSEKYARGLNWATWALVFATVVLAAVTIYKG